MRSAIVSAANPGAGTLNLRLRRRDGIPVLLPMLVLLSAVFGGPARAAHPASYPESSLARLGREDRLLVVSPHPDDESLCCGGVIARARTAGARVVIVWMTGGDAFELDAGWTERTLRPGREGLRALGARRMQEARSAAAALGVPEDAQIFLGFPDRGLLPLLLDHYDIAYTSPFTGLSQVGYPGTLHPGAAYLGRNVERALGEVLDRERPTYVLAPSPLDTHSDHRATGDFVIRALAERGWVERARFWVVHGGVHWPAPGGLHPRRGSDPPRGSSGMHWEAVGLDDPERARKLSALEAYHTQMFGLEKRFLLSFVRRDELFAREALPPASAASAPPRAQAVPDGPPK